VLSSAQIAGIRLPGDELERFDFVPLSGLEPVLIPRLARRVRACLSVRGRGGVYLEDGHPVGGAVPPPVEHHRGPDARC
jgi:hypothetical protein